MKRTYITLLLAAVAMCTFAAAPNGSGTYYQAANGKKGSALKTALCGIIYNRTEKSYDYLWTFFNTYDVRSDGKIWDMYSNTTNYVPGGSAQGHNYQGEGDSYNREHSFPKSWFGGEVTPMYTDLHHMYPTDGFVNNKRSNYPFGTTNGEDYKSNGGFCKLGACTYSGYSGTVFEPADEYKGDFARTYFYMVTCYEEKLADWYNGNADGVRATIDGSTYPAFTTWQLNMLLAWAAADPVSQKEIDRNNAIYTVQNNRNPFIDYSGLEQYIWGTKTDVAFSYDNYDGSGSGDDPDPGTDPNPGSAGTYKLTITAADFNSTSYAANNNEKTSLAICTTDASKTYEVKWTSYQVYKSSSKMQWQSGKGYIYNSTDLGTITDVTISSSEGTFTTYYGTSAQPSSSTTVGGGFFKTKVGNATGKTSKVEITFTIDGGAPSPVASDLALTGAPIALSFDLYNDGGAKTISYTTSSTGAVTVSESEYVTTIVSGNTITVTPVKVTPSAQTITVSQAADATYEAGSVTFTVTVGDSTPVGPTPSGEWVETPFADLTASDVFVIVGNNGNNYALPNDVTGSAPVATSVTVTDGKITDVADNLKWNITSKAKGYMFCPNGSSTTWLYCTNSNNGLRVGDNVYNNVFVMGEDGYLQNVGTSRYVGIYNSQDWRCYASTDVNIGGQTFKFYKYQVSVPVTVSELGCGTFASDYALDFSASEIRAFYATESGDNLIFHEVEKVPANTGVLLYKVGGASDNIPVYSGTADAVTGNAFVRGTGAAVSYTDDDKNYILFDGDDGLGFYKANNNPVATDRAYIHVPVSVNVKCFLLDLENDPTGIRSMEEVRGMMEDGVIFNLAGQRLQKMQKGINIVNGKKVLR